MIQQFFEDMRAIFQTAKSQEYPIIFLWIQDRIQEDLNEIYNKWEGILRDVQSTFGHSISPDSVARFQYLLWKIAHYKVDKTDFVRYCELHQSLSDLEARYRVQGKLCSVLQQINQSKM